MSRAHNLDFDHAKATAEELMVNFAEKYGVKYHWEDETVKFRGAGAKGYLSVLPKQVELRMELGFMLIPFKAKIEKSITNHMDEFCS